MYIKKEGGQVQNLAEHQILQRYVLSSCCLLTRIESGCVENIQSGQKFGINVE